MLENPPQAPEVPPGKPSALRKTAWSLAASGLVYGLVCAMGYSFSLAFLDHYQAIIVPALLTLLLAWRLLHTEQTQKKAQLQALNTLVLAWSDGEFNSAIVLPSNPDLRELTAGLNALGEALRRERRELLERERMLDAAVHSAPTALFLLDQSQIVVYANRAAHDFFRASGETHAQSMLGKSVPELLTSLPGPSSSAFAPALRAPNSSLISVETANGTEHFHVVNRDYRVRGQAHSLKSILRVTPELNRQEVHSWKKTIRVLSHELNNSLAPIRSLCASSQELLRRKQPEQLPALISLVDERALHLSKFLEQYARFAKLPLPCPELLPWQPFLTRIVQLAGCGTLTQNAALFGYFDPVQLEQVLLNLLRNALEAGSPANAIELSVHDINTQTCLRICDAGDGMDDAVLAQALLPFYSTKRQGSGIGLALCREILEAHGGSISLQRNSPRGMQVNLWLPRPNDSV